MKIINIDIDGVLRYFLQSAHTTLRQYYPDRTPEEMNPAAEWGMEAHYPQIPKKELLNFLFNVKAKEVFLENALPFHGAKAFLKALQERGYFVVLNTHQNSRTFQYTVEWLRREKFKYDYLIYSRGLDKHVVPGILVDDKFDNCDPKKDLLFTRPSNKDREYPKERRVNNYSEVLNYLDNL